jgi:hypothetical protein
MEIVNWFMQFIFDVGCIALVALLIVLVIRIIKGKD